ncbi:MAG: carbon-nitrogen hydrolase family protein [Pseudomonadota bacterium]
MATDTNFKAAVVQMRSGVSMDANIEALTGLVADAAKAGADYIQTPEMTGLVQRDRKAFFEAAQSEKHDPVMKAAAALAREHGVVLHIGSTPILLDGGKAANRAALFGPDGNRIAVYDKIHMFDVDLDNGESWRESAVYEPGRSGVMVDVLGARFGLGICYDCRFPALHNAYAKAGVSVLTSPSCFTRQTGRAHWHVLMRSRAIENGAFMISAAQGGDMEDGRETYGHSIIVNPWGDVIAEMDGEEPGIALADIDLAEVAAARAKVPNLVNQRAFDLHTADAGAKGGQMSAAS